MPPDLPDTGKDDGEWANALLYPPWRQIAPDTFDNGAGHFSKRDEPAPVLIDPFHTEGDTDA